MAKILIVDDEEKIRDLIKKYAMFDGYEVAEAISGLDAIYQLKEQQFDLMIIDVMMPELDGFSAVKEIRKTVDIPVIMLSARGEEYDRIHGFELGIDDYVVKPFSPKELMMRVSAILKRYEKEDKEHEIYEYDGIKVDFTARLVFVDDMRIDMSPKEYDLFFYMVYNRGIALTREVLLENVWGQDFFGDDRTLDTHIKMIRKYLGDHSGRITTLRGIGYRFEG